MQICCYFGCKSVESICQCSCQFPTCTIGNYGSVGVLREGGQSGQWAIGCCAVVRVKTLGHRSAGRGSVYELRAYAVPILGIIVHGYGVNLHTSNTFQSTLAIECGSGRNDLQINFSWCAESCVFHSGPFHEGSNVCSDYGSCIGDRYEGRSNCGTGPVVDCVDHRGDIGSVKRGPPYEI